MKFNCSTPAELLKQIKDGASHKKEPYISEIFSNALKKNCFSVTADGIYASKNSNIKIIAVPVALKKNKIELNALLSATNSISKGLKKGDAVIICPSLPPGTTETTVKNILEKNNQELRFKNFNSYRWYWFSNW